MTDENKHMQTCQDRENWNSMIDNALEHDNIYRILSVDISVEQCSIRLHVEREIA